MRRTLLGWNPTPTTKLTHRPSQLKTLQYNTYPLLFLAQTIVTMSEFSPHNSMQGWGSFGGNLGRGPPHCCVSSFLEITTRLTPVHFTNICMRFEDPQKMFFPVGWPSSPPPVRGVVMTSRSSGPVYGELGEEKYHQLWTHSSQNRLPLESSLRRQRHPVATSKRAFKWTCLSVCYICHIWPKHQKRHGQRPRVSLYFQMGDGNRGMIWCKKTASDKHVAPRIISTTFIDFKWGCDNEVELLKLVW